MVIVPVVINSVQGIVYMPNLISQISTLMKCFNFNWLLNMHYVVVDMHSFLVKIYFVTLLCVVGLWVKRP